MATTTGGGPSQETTLTRSQRRLESELGAYLKQFVGESATELGIPVVSKEEEMILGDLKAWYEGLPAKLEDMGIEEAAMRLLSGEPAFEIDLEESAELFGEAVAAPSFSAFSKYVVPEIKRQYKGVTSRRGRKIVEKSTELSQALAAELAKFQISEIAAGRGAKESAMGRVPAGMAMATQLMGMLPTAGLGLASAFGGVQATKVAEAQRLLPENSPWMSQQMNFLGIPMTTWQDKPATMTGYGQAMQGLGTWGPALGAGMAASTAATAGGATAGGAAGAGGLAALTAVSDKRLKRNIKYLCGLFAMWIWNKKAEVLGLRGVSFGFIAQDIEKIYPDAVIFDNTGYRRILYSKLSAVRRFLLWHRQ